jgi:hypothetical protein
MRFLGYFAIAGAAASARDKEKLVRQNEEKINNNYKEQK